MKLILTSTVDKLGIAGDIVEVRNGYGRNYLVPQKSRSKVSSAPVTPARSVASSMRRSSAPRSRNSPSRFRLALRNRVRCSAQSPPRTWPWP